MTDTPMFEDVAQELGNNLGYQVVGYVACGAFKETYEAKTTEGDRIALKLMNPDKCNLCRTDRELDSMRRCDHESIGRLLDSGDMTSSSGVKFFYSVEEFFDGGSLGKRIDALDSDACAEYGYHLAGAVGHLSGLNLVHRDIKPENVMFRAGSHHPILVDFGLVRDLSKTTLTKSWQPIGPCTPFFAAPEQLNNEKAMIDWRTDQFTLAVVIAFCLIGQHPFAPTQHATGGAAIDAVANREVCPEWFRVIAEAQEFAFLLKMMHPWPNRRYVDPEDMIQAFDDRR